MEAELMSRVQTLTRTFENLRTFQEVHEWDSEAERLAGELEQSMSRVRADASSLVARADQLRAERARLPFFKRLFASRAPERDLRQRGRLLVEVADRLGMAMNDLLERIDYTPNDEQERKTLLKELRSEKKELQLAKREIAAEKREINRAAREASASAGQGIFFYDRKAAAAERRAIRRQRAAALAPYEDKAASIDQEIRELDRRIAWVDRVEARPQLPAMNISARSRRARS